MVASCNSAEPAVVIPAPSLDQELSAAPTLERAVLAGGCFWGVQGVFQHVQGVARVLSGYAGGSKQTANYQAVGLGTTGHAEAVQISFDNSQVTFGQLLHVFFSVAHNPTQLNRQGPDHGSQYRSAIFPQNPRQKQMALAYMDQLNRAKVFDGPIVTAIEEDHPFYAAEDYHQDYLTLNPHNPYIAHHDIPKVRNLARLFPALYRDRPRLVSG